MSCKIALSIAMTSVIALHSGMSFAETSTEAPVTVSAQPTSQHGGKCAAGKCGTEKRFEKQDLKSDPQGRLVRARDGKCGLTGEGITPSTETVVLTNSKITGGVCGQ